MISIITPTYNRCHTLDKAYKSLLKQTNKDFEWIIVDDGSIDETEKLVKKFIKEKKINISYYYKENGGKHTAINTATDKVKGEYVLILDSDDTLLDNAIELVKTKWEKYRNNNKIACLSFLKVFPNNKTIGKEYFEKEIISNHIDFRYNRGLLGDMCEVFKTDILKKYKFPVFDNERFLSEAIIWNKIALKYDTVYINTPIYKADYLSDGLSTNFFKLVYNNPIGASENSKMFLNKRFKLKIRVKNAILYSGYCLLSHKKINKIIKDCNNKTTVVLFLPLGILFYLFLKFKFKDGN